MIIIVCIQITINPTKLFYYIVVKTSMNYMRTNSLYEVPLNNFK